MVVSASTNQVWTKITIGSYAHVFCHSESDTSGVTLHQMHTYVVSCLARTKNLEWPQIIVKLILMKVNWKCVICAHSRRSKTKHSFTTLRWNTKRKRDLTVLAVIVNSTLNIRWKDISKVRFKLDQNLTLFGTGFEMKEKNVHYNSAT